MANKENGNRGLLMVIAACMVVLVVLAVAWSVMKWREGRAEQALADTVARGVIQAALDDLRALDRIYEEVKVEQGRMRNETSSDEAYKKLMKIRSDLEPRRGDACEALSAEKLQSLALASTMPDNTRFVADMDAEYRATRDACRAGLEKQLQQLR